MSGRVVVVGTPIGNLGDISERAREALAAADVIACEDTRRTGRLLSLLGIAAPKLVRSDDHTEAATAGRLVARALEGALVAVVSDAGMPSMADPGAAIVDAAIDAGVPVEVVPGPFAGVVALVMSGMVGGNGRFCFEGFLPRKAVARSARLAELADERRTMVFYESPHRLVATVQGLSDAFGTDRRVALCRELTKMHEEVVRTDLGTALEHLGAHPPKGEYVIVVDPAPPPAAADDDALVAALVDELAAGASGRDAVAAVVERFGAARNRVKALLAERVERD